MAIITKSITQTLSLTTPLSISGSRNLIISQNYRLTQKISRSYSRSIIQSLSFSQKVGDRETLHLSDRLSFNQSNFFRKRSVLFVSDTLLFSDNFFAEYSLLNIVPYTIPKISKSGYFEPCTLSLNATGLSFALPLSITLPAPDFGDSEELTVKRVNKKNFGNRGIVFHAPIWGNSTIYHLTFSSLNTDERVALQNFYNVSFGAAIVYTGYKGEILAGIITTPYLEFIEVNNCTWKVSFDFSIFGGGDG